MGTPRGETPCLAMAVPQTRCPARWRIPIRGANPLAHGPFPSAEWVRARPRLLSSRPWGGFSPLACRLSHGRSTGQLAGWEGTSGCQSSSRRRPSARTPTSVIAARVPRPTRRRSNADPRSRAQPPDPDRRAEIRRCSTFPRRLRAEESTRSGKVSRGLHAHPLYVIIGPPGAGKTTALEASGLSFPLSGPDGTRVRGLGGTHVIGGSPKRPSSWTPPVATHRATTRRWLSFLRLLAVSPAPMTLSSPSARRTSSARARADRGHGKRSARVDELMMRLGRWSRLRPFTKPTSSRLRRDVRDLKKSDRKRHGAPLSLSPPTGRTPALFRPSSRAPPAPPRRRSTRPRHRARPRAPGIHVRVENVRDSLPRSSTPSSRQSLSGTPLFRGFYSPAAPGRRERRATSSTTCSERRIPDAALAALSPGASAASALVLDGAVTAAFATFLC